MPHHSKPDPDMVSQLWFRLLFGKTWAVFQRRCLWAKWGPNYYQDQQLGRVFLGLWEGRKTIFPPGWPVGAVSAKPLGYHLWMGNPAMLKEGHHTQPHLSCLNLHFPFSVGESGCAQASLWNAHGVPPPSEEEMGRGRHLFWYYLKAESLSKDVELVANLISSGSVSTCSVNFTAVIPGANKLQQEGI